ncbi:hypothetical protein [Sulfitobacter sp. R18_1]|uniref:hypothetical protein n=1 Tax=Sulfitobacter sp. R18_1 TaxID=2821104 RepID=UPI001ADCE6C6|nr:hypothetical protein [Sulfitobacter sp. R18_1]MBO9430623.1 hypothetical protein [Sulfitobacter sp. R18_1]
MIIRKANFKGEIPRVHPRLIPVNYAQRAENTRLDDGTIGPIKAATTAHTFATAPNTFMKFNGDFIGFTQSNVKATVGPVAQDRLYFTGEGSPKMRVSGTDYALSLAPPNNPPTATASSVETGGAPSLYTTVDTTPIEGSEDEQFYYRYSAVTDRGETVASAPASIYRIDGEYVVLHNMVLPAGTTKIRVYRNDPEQPSGETGRFGLILDVEYSAGTHGPLSDATITDQFWYFPDLGKAPVEKGDDAVAVEYVTYVYTYVTEFDEESAPSPPSDLVKVGPLSTVSYTVAAPVQSGRGVDRIRVYRSKTSLSGITDYYFLTEFSSGSAGTKTDDFQQILNEPITSIDYDRPDSDMMGLIALPNGLMAAHAGREVMFCEPYKPHAWPEKYRLTTDTDIVGLAAFGAYVAVMTEGAPYLIHGSDPGLMVMEKMERTLPCLNAHSIVDLGYSAAFASHEGLVVINQNGAEVRSRNLFTEQQWREMQPDTMRAEQLNGRYVFSFRRIGSAANETEFGIIDLSNEQPFYIRGDMTPGLLYFDPLDGALYYTEINDTRVIKQFDPKLPGTVAKQKWRSKINHLPGYDNFGAILVETDEVTETKATPSDPDCTVRVYADGALVHTLTTTNTAERLPSGFLAEKWEVEIEGYAAVTAISIATDIAELVGG